MVIPVKDDARFLDACLRSLASQTTSAHEVIVVDNNSSDDSGDVARLHGATVLHEARPGIAAAAGSGYDHATGDVIARLDADSVAHDRWIEVLTDAFNSRPDVDAFTGSATFTDGPEAWRGLAARAYLGAYFVTASSALSHAPLFGSNFAMRTAAWISVRPEVPRVIPGSTTTLTFRSIWAEPTASATSRGCGSASPCVHSSKVVGYFA